VQSVSLCIDRIRRRQALVDRVIIAQREPDLLQVARTLHGPYWPGSRPAYRRNGDSNHDRERCETRKPFHSRDSKSRFAYWLTARQVRAGIEIIHHCQIPVRHTKIVSAALNVVHHFILRTCSYERQAAFVANLASVWALQETGPGFPPTAAHPDLCVVQK
jgi:hypothetical protein